MRLIYHPAAEAELIEAAQFYQARVPQLGAQFLVTAGGVFVRGSGGTGPLAHHRS